MTVVSLLPAETRTGCTLPAAPVSVTAPSTTVAAAPSTSTDAMAGTIATFTRRSGEGAAAAITGGGTTTAALTMSAVTGGAGGAERLADSL